MSIEENVTFKRVHFLLIFIHQALHINVLLAFA